MILKRSERRELEFNRTSKNYRINNTFGTLELKPSTEHKKWNGWVRPFRRFKIPILVYPVNLFSNENTFIKSTIFLSKKLIIPLFQNNIFFFNKGSAALTFE